ncbi:hypothetical protein [Pseudomonas phage pPA-3099-2aT.2]|uniref:Uncharacterized protein n=1 Tax=Pseudomonas phage pPA-3099-2aT.2 TaxID=3003808 RepID=A0AAE9W5A4_9CAUD|nr:hypothetical protein QE325_gp091 [Pseudomonas phage pPA-3099-2aT.2]WBQ35182.1 hypothetical protein [Pseudomonas phage pPA-3099-2aT.2]
MLKGQGIEPVRRERRRKPFITGEEERVSCCGIEPPIAMLREPAILALLAYDPESLKRQRDIPLHDIGWRRGLEPQQSGHNRKAASGLHNLHTNNAKPAESTYGGMFRLGLDWSSYRGSNPEHQIESLAI